MTRLIGQGMLLLAVVLAGLSSYDVGDLLLAVLAVLVAWAGGMIAGRGKAGGLTQWTEQ